MVVDFLEDYKVFRRLLLAWACWLISWVVLQVFTDLSQITAAVASALGVVVGLLATVIAFYTHQRFKEDRD